MGLPAVAENYLFIGPLIQQRLQQLVGDVPVDLVERTEQVLDADKRVRVLMVMYGGDRFDVGPNGRTVNSQLVYQRWLVFLATNNVGKGQAARLAPLGPLLSTVHKALAGWVPQGAVHAMQRANGPQPTFTDSKAVLPLGWEINLSI